MKKPHPSSPPEKNPDDQLARGLRFTSSRLESGFDDLQARLARENTQEAKVIRFPRPMHWIGVAVALAAFALLSTQWLSRSPSTDHPPIVVLGAPDHLEEMLTLDEILAPARPLLLDDEVILALLEMPYENQNY
jgi:hypothetical protein